MKTLLWILLMLVVTGFVTYLALVALRGDRELQREHEHRGHDDRH